MHFPLCRKCWIMIFGSGPKGEPIFVEPERCSYCCNVTVDGLYSRVPITGMSCNPEGR